ncbi:hypothetical protein SAMN05443582_101892 [Phyllobacterium sp. OV277]|nr:hypothetical protein SAMN05443582_101892 [Phyllobacterium sp. OV277]
MSIVRGSWFDKLTMREMGDAILITNVAKLGSLRSPLSVILGLNPRTEDDGEGGGCREFYSAIFTISVASPISLMVSLSNHEPRTTNHTLYPTHINSGACSLTQWVKLRGGRPITCCTLFVTARPSTGGLLFHATT